MQRPQMIDSCSGCRSWRAFRSARPHGLRRRTAVAALSAEAGQHEQHEHGQQQAPTRRDTLLRVLASPALAAAALQLPVAAPARAADGVPSQGPPGALLEVLALNRRVQAQNRAPAEFPAFVRQGFDILVIADDYQETADGLLFKDFKEGIGAQPQEGQQVVFDYTGYNESGVPIDSSYRQGRPAETRLGIAGLIPGFELGIRSMKVGGKRRIIVPPKLGPPVGPSTFFSAKQCEVFDIELRGLRTCRQEQVMMFSRVVCE